jgi:hypothetical protein
MCFASAQPKGLALSALYLFLYDACRCKMENTCGIRSQSASGERYTNNAILSSITIVRILPPLIEPQPAQRSTGVPGDIPKRIDGREAVNKSTATPEDMEFLLQSWSALRRSNSEPRMSVEGQKASDRRARRVRGMSAVPPIAPKLVRCSDSTKSVRTGLLRCNKVDEIQRVNLPKTALNQMLLNNLVGAAEQKIGIHWPFAFDIDAAVRLKPRARPRPE